MEFASKAVEVGKQPLAPRCHMMKGLAYGMMALEGRVVLKIGFPLSASVLFLSNFKTNYFCLRNILCAIILLPDPSYFTLYGNSHDLKLLSYDTYLSSSIWDPFRKTYH